MGYAVYEDRWNPGRWAGYAVPAECDWPGCEVRINRGMGYQCETHIDPATDGEEDTEGCYMYFCSDHLYEDHPDTIEPKDDSVEWKWWLLVAPSWAEWRNENPDTVAEYREAVEKANYRPTQHNLVDLMWDAQDTDDGGDR